MAEHITAVTCVAGDWTLVASNVSLACFQWRSEIAVGKWTFGASKPELDTEDYWTLRARTPQSLNELSTGTQIWAMPLGSAPQVMEVVTP